MPNASPKEFRREVVAAARACAATLSQIARDFGISESSVHRWLKLADIDDGVGPGHTGTKSGELRDLRRRNRVRGQENEIRRRESAFSAREPLPK